MSRVSLINDWEFLFNKHPAWGRFSTFTFFMLSYFHLGLKDPDIDGITIIILGIGVRIKV
jgi:hypothetical protein